MSLPRTSRPVGALFRFAPARYLIAELIPFGFILMALLLAREFRTIGAAVGFSIAFIGGTFVTTYYLYKVLGSSAAWCFPLVLLMYAQTDLASTILGIGIVYDAAHPHGTRPVATGTDWLAWGSALGAIAVLVALAAATGERWTRRHQPRDRLDATSRVRGGMAWLWLASYRPQERGGARAGRF
jgi:hypothetical protein